jgi:hypothetical protein
VYFQSQQRAADTGMVGIQTLPCIWPPHTDAFKETLLCLHILQPCLHRALNGRDSAGLELSISGAEAVQFAALGGVMVCAHSMDDSMHCLGLCFFWLFTGYKAEVSVMGKRINYIIPLFLYFSEIPKSSIFLGRRCSSRCMGRRGK